MFMLTLIFDSGQLILAIILHMHNSKGHSKLNFTLHTINRHVICLITRYCFHNENFLWLCSKRFKKSLSRIYTPWNVCNAMRISSILQIDFRFFILDLKSFPFSHFNELFTFNEFIVFGLIMQKYFPKGSIPMTSWAPRITIYSSLENSTSSECE